LYSGGGAINLSNNAYLASSVTPETLETLKANYSSLLARIQAYFNGETLAQIPDQTNKPNIIIVLSESLSMVDSKYAGGLFNRLPMIDKLQQEGLVFKHAVSNGKITPHGLAAFVLGIQTTITGGFAGMMDQFPPA